MAIPHILALAIGLAMDAFAVAIATGVTLKTVSFRQTFRLSWHFGLFQALMPVIGWSAGLTIQDLIQAWDHWMAFGLLLLVGGNMLREALGQETDECVVRDPTKGFSLVILSVATSIDALAVGLSLAVMQVSIVTPCVMIGVVAGVFTLIGLHLGKRLANACRISRYAEMTGGVVLILIGLNILREHGALSWLIT
ncbi:MAG: manganese efflux pump MntP family protein [Desulfobacterales bacterium]